MLQQNKAQINRILFIESKVILLISFLEDLCLEPEEPKNQQQNDNPIPKVYCFCLFVIASKVCVWLSKSISWHLWRSVLKT